MVVGFFIYFLRETMASSSTIIVRSNDTPPPVYEEPLEYPPIDKLQDLEPFLYRSKARSSEQRSIPVHLLHTETFSLFKNI